MIEQYKNINSDNIITKYPTEIYPIPVLEDYENGYMIRYFVKLKTNINSNIVEVDEKQYKFYLEQNKFSNGLFYCVKLRWRIKGLLEDVQISNNNILKLKEKYIPNLSLKLNNLIQFWKE